MTSYYATRIAQLAPDHDPAHIEAWMRLQHSTLDGLSTDTFAHEVRLAITLTDAVGLNEADELARSYGLQPATRAPTADVEYDVGDEVPPDDRDRRRAG